MTWEVRQGDNLALMRAMPDASVDAIVCDPPYGFGNKQPGLPEMLAYLQGADIDTGGDFMGKDWAVPTIAQWRECLRVLKPGGHLVAFAGARTQDLIALGIRCAGFDVRDTLMWIYGSGFPKSADVSKAIDRAAGAEREVVGVNPRAAQQTGQVGTLAHGNRCPSSVLTAPSTQAAKDWQGWGTALKPAYEPAILARKPVNGTVASNVQTYGTGALNVDGCRIGTGDDIETPDGSHYGKGRWPANVGLVHADGCVRVGERVVGNGELKQSGARAPRGNPVYGKPNTTRNAPDNYGTETIPEYDCEPGCPVAALGEMSGESVSCDAPRNNGEFKSQSKGFEYGHTTHGHSDHGTAARFFTTLQSDPTFLYQAKASRRERELGCEDLPVGNWTDGREVPNDTPRLRDTSARRNTHPTCKPISVMRWLCKLVTPPGGLVLDPWAGSGSTGCAAMLEGFSFIGCELEPEYVDIARARILFHLDNPRALDAPPVPVKPPAEGQGSLF